MDVERDYFSVLPVYEPEDDFWETITNSQDYKTYIDHSSPCTYSDISLRCLMLLYFYYWPSSSQADFARDLGTHPMTLSRALTGDDKVRDEWKEAVHRIFSGCDSAHVRYQFEKVLDFQDQRNLASNRFTLFKLISEYLVKKGDLQEVFELQNFDNTTSFCIWVPQKAERWLFFNYDSINTESTAKEPLPFQKLETLCLHGSIQKITVFTHSANIFEQLLGKFFLENHSFSNSIQYCSLMYTSPPCFDFCVNKEYTLLARTE